MSDKSNVGTAWYGVRPTEGEAEAFSSPATQEALKRVVEACEKFGEACRKMGESRSVRTLRVKAQEASAPYSEVLRQEPMKSRISGIMRG